jgi:hypothetical protein
MPTAPAAGHRKESQLPLAGLAAQEFQPSRGISTGKLLRFSHNQGLIFLRMLIPPRRTYPPEYETGSTGCMGSARNGHTIWVRSRMRPGRRGPGLIALCGIGGVGCRVGLHWRSCSKTTSLPFVWSAPTPPIAMKPVTKMQCEQRTRAQIR